MTSEIKHEVKPKLRFPEFRYAPGWDKELLGELFSHRQEIGFQALPLLSLTEKEGVIPQEESNRKNNSTFDKSRYLRVCPGDIAYNTMRMWEGRSALVGIEGVVSPAYTVCKPNDEVNGLFFSYYFKTHQLIKQFRKYSQGLVKDTLNLKFSAFSEISVSTPSYLEQQRVANCLSSTDNLIAAQSQKLDALQTYKKGLLQALFPAEGETVPRLRFPEFQNAPDWEEKRLEDVLSLIVRQKNKPTDPYTGLGVRSHGKGTFLKNLEIPEKNSMEYLYEVQNEDLIVNITFAWEGAIAIAQKVDTGALVSHRFPTYIFKRDVAIPEFFQYVIVDKQFVYKLGVISPGGAGRNRVLNRSDFLKLTVLLPQDIDEQQKIADSLSCLNEQIDSQNQKLDALNAHKKGLMQQLFPSLGEV